jgi:uncharacterized protein (DUF1697 family)
MALSVKSKSRRAGAATGYVAFLRGVNVGGKNKVAMAELGAMFVEAGCAEARTYIQSGNVAFVAMKASAERIPDLVSKKNERTARVSDAHCNPVG